MKRVLITGGAGFIGSHLAQAWIERGAHVVILDSLRTGHMSNLEIHQPDDYTFLRGSVEDGKLVERAMEGVDVVHHLAALVSVPESVEKPTECEAINALGTLNVLEAARKAGVDRVVFSSTSAVYGMIDRPIHSENDAPAPLSPYAVTKLAGEYWMNMYRELHGLSTVSLRYFNVYGPRQDPKSPYAAAIAIFSERAADNKPITIFGNGEQTRDFVFVKDVVAANLLAATTDKGLPPVMNVACSGSITVNELAHRIVELSGSQSNVVHLPERAGDVRHSRGNSELLQGIGWAPKTSLAEGLRLTLAEHETHVR